MKKVLIANRGEIAVRIARACADYRVQSVAVYADADCDALHTRMADAAYSLGGDSPADTYLHSAKLLDAAQRSGADALHPGYGFLSERAEFAQAVIDAGLTWIGPPPAAMACLGDKVQARHIARSVGVPMVAGTAEPVRDVGEVLDFARQHGLPIIIKAALGGGGRGMKIAWHLDEVADLYASAVREALAAFGHGACFVEQFLARTRHIEAQVLADTQGHLVVLGTRDCSLQRRNQKLVEEAPAPFLSDALRGRIHQAAHDLCAAVGYTNAGTVEFLLSDTGTLAFLEVNTRLQVEHTVTEQTTGIDLVVEQLRIADGLPLSVHATPAPQGHAMEFRINAEDVGRGFLPAPGVVQCFAPPSGPGVRLDAGVASQSSVPAQFDSLVAKLIITGANRTQVLARARRALHEFRIDGLATVLPFHRAVVEHPDFADPAAFQVHTRWIETVFANTVPAGPRPVPPPSAALHRVALEIDGRRVLLGLPAGLLRMLQPQAHANTHADAAGAWPDATPAHSLAPSSAAPAPGSVTAPIAGMLHAWKVANGSAVQEGALLGVMEAMKMEMPIRAPCSGHITLLAEPGSTQPQDAVLAHIA